VKGPLLDPQLCPNDLRLLSHVRGGLLLVDPPRPLLLMLLFTSLAPRRTISRAAYTNVLCVLSLWQVRDGNVWLSSLEDGVGHLLTHAHEDGEDLASELHGPEHEPLPLARPPYFSSLLLELPLMMARHRQLHERWQPLIRGAGGV